MSSPGLPATYAYDALGRPSAQTITAFGGTFVTQYGYDTGSGRLDTLAYPSDSGTAPLRVRHHYDRGRLVRLSDADNASTTFWRADALDALGEVAAETLGNGVRVDSERDAVTGRLRRADRRDRRRHVAPEPALAWDAVGNLLQREERNLRRLRSVHLRQSRPARLCAVPAAHTST